MKPLLFLDTDIGPDCDDMAAVAILLQLCREEKAALLGITHCTGSPYGLSAIDCLCQAFHMQLPLGTCQDKHFLADGIRYTPELARRFPHHYPPEQPQPDAVDIFCQAMKSAPDQGVTLATIGPLNNIAAFLRYPPAKKHMEEKVKRIVVMGGSFERETPYQEWNIKMDIPAAQALMEKWRGPIDFCPSETFANVLTGACLEDYPDNPVTVAYRLFLKGGVLRPSWDPGTIAAAVEEPKAPLCWSVPGRVSINSQGYCAFSPDPYGKHRYLRNMGDPAAVARPLEEMLKRAMETMEKGN